jgi:hypothetical protein
MTADDPSITGWIGIACDDEAVMANAVVARTIASLFSTSFPFNCVLPSMFCPAAGDEAAQ